MSTLPQADGSAALRRSRAGMARGQPWSTQSCAALIRLYSVDRLSLKDIAAHFNRTPHSIGVKLSRMRKSGKLTVRRDPCIRPCTQWPDDQVALLRKLWGAFSDTEIAEKIGRTRGAVSSMASRLKLAAGGVGAPPRRKARDGEQKSKPKADRAVRQPKPKPAVLSKVKSAVAAKPAPVRPPRPFIYRPPPVATLDPVPDLPVPAFQSPKGGNLVVNPVRGYDFARPAARFMAGMTDRQKAATIAAHVADLAPDAVITAAGDLFLCEAIWTGQRVDVAAARMRLPLSAVVARFNKIVAPMRHPDARGLPIEAAVWVLPALRARLCDPEPVHKDDRHA